MIFTRKIAALRVDPKRDWVGNVHPDTKGDPCIAAAQNILYSTCNT